MKPHFQKTLLLLSGLMAGSQLFAQTDTTQNKNFVKPFAPAGSFRTLSVGFETGILSDYTLFNIKTNYLTHRVQFGFGGFIKEQILPALGIQANLFVGKMEGYDAAYADANGVKYKQFDTKINWALSGSLVYTFANVDWRYHKSFLQPYAKIGAGAITYTPSYTVAGQTTTLTRGNNENFQELFIPVGVGTKINISRGINFDLGYDVNFVNATNLYALHNNTRNDRFSYAHAGIEFAIGSRKKPQLASYNPVSSMYYDYTMQNTALRSALDAQKAENEKLRSDLNATNANVTALNTKLTQDSDGDGVPDLFDKCPNTPAGTKVDGSGCPLPKAENVKVYVTEEDKKVVKDAIANLEFDLGKATIREHSLPSLDKVAELLVNKNFSLKLAGHTDNSGSAALNMRLSKDRAEAIKTYLVSKGANASRIEAVGYGMTQPIATNKTAAGRQQNRRVEFTLY